MKNIFVFYIALLAPLSILVPVFQQKLLPSGISIFLLLMYVLVYRTYIDGMRLVCKNLIKRKDIWKVATHGWRVKYFKELYLKY